MMKYLFKIQVWFLLVICTALPVLAKKGIEEIIDSEGKLWQKTPENFFTGTLTKQFRWLSNQQKDAARYPSRGTGTGLTFLDMKIWESIVRFKEGKAARIEISLYNRGDAGVVSEESFEQMIVNATQKLDVFWGIKGAVIAEERLGGSRAKIYQKAWIKGPNQLLLKWSSTGKRKEFRPEYIQVTITPFDAKNDPRKSHGSSISKKRAGMKSKEEILANITRKEDGTVYLANMPMVDQGQKGYCAVATAERILRYYGTEVDQHVIAQLADSAADRGTNPELMMEMLKKTGVKFGVKVKVLYGFEWRKLMKEFKNYNKLAKKKGKPEVKSGGRIINIGSLYAQLDGETWKQYRLEKLKTDYKRFQKNIKANIDKGIPLAWSVNLGIIPEKGLPQRGGGHMRLIIGYNDSNQQIVYSDSWGARHEFKVMPMDDAWAITSCMASMTSRKK